MLVVYIVGNAGIVACYLALAIASAALPVPAVRVRDRYIGGVVIRWSAISFFLLCGVTHADLLLHAIVDEPLTIADMSSPYHAASHAAQFISAAIAAVGLLLLNHRRRKAFRS